jgi:hypothetical protein
MTVLFLLVAWIALSVPVAMLAGRFLRNSSSHDLVFVRAAHAAVTADRGRRRAG